MPRQIEAVVSIKRGGQLCNLSLRGIFVFWDLFLIIFIKNIINCDVNMVITLQYENTPPPHLIEHLITDPCCHHAHGYSRLWVVIIPPPVISVSLIPVFAGPWGWLCGSCLRTLPSPTLTCRTVRSWTTSSGNSRSNCWNHSWSCPTPTDGQSRSLQPYYTWHQLNLAGLHVIYGVSPDLLQNLNTLP
jgi:hypothetical protein